MNKYKRFFSCMICLALILSIISLNTSIARATEISFTVSPSYSSSETLAGKTITVEADGHAFMSGSAYPRIIKDNVDQQATINIIESTSTKISFRLPNGLNNGTYSIKIEGPEGYKYESVGNLVIADPSIFDTPHISLENGYSQQTINITGQYTNFIMGQSIVEVLSGSTVLRTPTVTGVNTGTQTITFTLNSGLSPGDYNIRVTTGSEVVIKENALKVRGTPSILLGTSSLSSAYEGGTTISVTGTNTGFNSSRTVVNILYAEGEDEGESTGTIGSVNVTNVTNLNFSVNTGLNAGLYNVRVQTDNEIAYALLTVVDATASLQRQSNSQVVSQIGEHYQNIQLKLVGSNTSFSQGTTQFMVFDESETDITEQAISGSPSISGQTINFTLASGLGLGTYTIRATTNSETVEAGFDIVEPTISLVLNSAVASGNQVAHGYTNFTINIVGTNTHFNSNSTVKIDGTAISRTYSSATSMSFTLSSGRTTGTYEVEVDFDGNSETEDDRVSTTFAVKAQPTITGVSPNNMTNQSGSAVTITVQGSGTHFTRATGSPSVDILGFIGESISNITVINDTVLTFDLIPNSITSTGNYGISVTTNGSAINETASGNSLLNVTNIGVISNVSTVYSLELGKRVVTLTSSGFAFDNSVDVTVGGIPALDVNRVSDNIATFIVPQGLTTGSNSIQVNNLGTLYNTSILVVESYINSFSPVNAIHGYEEFELTIIGNSTVDFMNNVPNVSINGYPIAGVEQVEGQNRIKFMYPEGFEGGTAPQIALSWAEGKYEGKTLITQNFNVEHEIDSLTIRHSGSNAPSSMTRYLYEESITFSARGNVTRGEGSNDKTSVSIWESSNTNVAEVINGVVTFKSAGTTMITASYDGQSDFVNLTVQGPQTIIITGDSNSPLINEEIELQSTALYGDSTVVDISEITVWSSSNETRANVINGLVTALSSGSVNIYSDYGGRRGTYSMTVSDISISPVAFNSVLKNKEVTVLGISTQDLSPISIEIGDEEFDGDLTIVNESSFKFSLDENINAGTHTVEVETGGHVFSSSILIRQTTITPSLLEVEEGYESFNLVITGTNITLNSSDRKPSITVDGNSIDGQLINVLSTSTLEFPFPEDLTQGTYEIILLWAAGPYEGKSLSTNINVTEDLTASPTPSPTASATPTPTISATASPTPEPTSSAPSGGSPSGGSTDEESRPVETNTSTDKETDSNEKEISNADGSLTKVDILESKATTEYTADIIVKKISETIRENKDIITLKFENEAAKQEILIDTDALNTLGESQKDVALEVSFVNILLPSEVFEDFLDKSMRVSLSEVEDVISDEGDMSKIGKILEFKIYSISDGKETMVSEFRKNITIEIPVDKDVIDKVNTKKLGLYYLNESLNKWEYIGGKYDGASGKVKSQTSHFSKFSVFEFNKTFDDVSNNHWGKELIEVVAARHITVGVDNHNFDPNGKVTRAQFATFMARVLKLPIESYKGTFKDVEEGQWYTPYVEAAAKAGVVSGVGEGNFDPHAVINREQMATMIINTYKFAAGKVEMESDGYVFSDLVNASSWAIDSIKAAYQMGIIKGMTESTFEPSQSAQRDHAAAMIYNLLEVLNEF